MQQRDSTGIKPLTTDDQKEFLSTVFAHSPVGMAFLDPNLIVQSANYRYARQICSTVRELIGKHASEIVPGWHEHFANVDWANKATPFEVKAYPYRFPAPSQRGVTYWDASFAPICGQQGRFLGWLFMQRDVTKIIRSMQERDFLLERISQTNDQLTLSNIRAQQNARQAEAAKVAAERAANYLGRLQSVTERLSAALTLSEVADIIVEQSVAALRASAGCLVLLDAVNNQVRLAGAIGYSDDVIERCRQFPLIPNGPLSMAMKNKELQFYEYSQMARFTNLGTNSGLISEKTQVFVCVPLIANNTVLGALGLSFTEHCFFTEGDQSLLRALAQQCAQALERANLYDALEQARAQLESRVEERTWELAESNAVLRREMAERIQAQAALAQAQEEKERLQNQFIQIAAHELRNPMAAVKGICSLLRRRVENGRTLLDLPQKLTILQREIDRLADLVNEMLEAYRVQRGYLSLNKMRINLESVLHASLATFMAVDEEKHQFLLECINQREAWVWGDPRRLEDVMRNILSNAVKYSPTHSPVIIRLLTTAEKATLIVQDKGVGIPADQLDSIFTSFFRATNVVLKGPGGLGLGLRICQDIVEQHNGRIWAESVLNEGTTFYMELPVCQ